ncbi:MAG: hypothetical protein ACI4NI_08365, partial [Candidatus Ornithospirochaeta sp.]
MQAKTFNEILMEDPIYRLKKCVELYKADNTSGIPSKGFMISSNFASDVKLERRQCKDKKMLQMTALGFLETNKEELRLDDTYVSVWVDLESGSLMFSLMQYVRDKDIAYRTADAMMSPTVYNLSAKKEIAVDGYQASERAHLKFYNAQGKDTKSLSVKIATDVL